MMPEDVVKVTFDEGEGDISSRIYVQPAAPSKSYLQADLDAVLQADEPYQAIVSRLQALEQSVAALEAERVRLRDSLADADERDLRDTFDAIQTCDEQIAVAQAKIRKINATLEAEQIDAVRRKIDALDAEAAELKERAEELKVDDDRIKQMFELPIGDIAARGIYELQQRYNQAQQKYGLTAQHAQKLRKLLSVRWGVNHA